MRKKLWHSASAMSWLAMAIRLSGFAILLPLVLYYFSADELTVWLLFSAIASFQLIIDFGFGQTFSREIAYGFVGRSLGDLHNPSVNQAPLVKEATAKPNWDSIQSATRVMLWIYLRLALLAILLFGILGTWAATGPIERVASPNFAWIAWVIVIVSTAFSIYGSAYASFLIGANEIGLQKRWEALVGGIALSAQIIVLITGAGLLGLVLVAQLGLIVQILVNRSLCLHVSDGRFGKTTGSNLDKRLLYAMWPAVWRTAIGSIMSLGVSRGMAITMANILVASEAATVLLALRLIQTISQISNVPFYIKIPELNRLRASRQISLLAKKSAKYIQTSLFLYVIGAILVDLLGRQLFAYIGSQTQFPDHLFWSTLMLAVLAERFGAMHIQLLLSNNTAIAHVANGISGIIWIVGLFFLFPIMGSLALPLSMLIAYAGFYAWYPVLPTLRSIPEVSFWKFEGKAALIPVALLITWVIYITPI
ncbi:hypothetical protein OAE49_04935 [Gammaproteobacteria bacterium]|nr:hypothetical protein [Gammaproteobacteria bacterium]